MPKVQNITINVDNETLKMLLDKMGEQQGMIEQLMHVQNAQATVIASLQSQIGVLSK